MAHFAQLDSNNRVIEVIVVSNNDLLDENGQESETKGIIFCQNILGGRWVQTSYNSTIRKNFAGIGFTYDQVRDAFIPPKPFLSWILNEDLCQWEAPVDYPSDGSFYVWDEESGNWIIPTEELPE